eukprot:6461883-Pyramimonas_sp.AAC.3
MRCVDSPSCRPGAGCKMTKAQQGAELVSAHSTTMVYAHAHAYARTRTQTDRQAEVPAAQIQITLNHQGSYSHQVMAATCMAPGTSDLLGHGIISRT